MNRIKSIIRKCKASESSVFRVLCSHAYYELVGKQILANDRVTIRGVDRIETSGLLQIGISYVGFMHKYDKTYLNVQGRLIFKGEYSIGKGCRFDIGKEAVATFGKGYVAANSNFIIMHGLTVGDGCAISWDCQFLDEDFHQISYHDRVQKDNSIEIGNRVWIGSNVLVLKGSKIPNGCVVAAGSVVTGAFNKENVLIAGNPARIIKHDIKWE
jgi:acetyltransferase-like isoleucine patch superfamily enzyme